MVLSIRSQFQEALARVAREHPPQSMGCEVFEDATMRQCVGYTQKFVVAEEKGSAFNRYDHYREVLGKALDVLPRGEQLVHVDVGCGPGLCSWVAHDIGLHTGDHQSVMLALDRVPNMVRLADRLWEMMQTACELRTFSRLPRLIEAGRARAVGRTVVVGFGHVLTQTLRKGRDNKVFSDFAELLDALHSGSRICLVVGADAHGSQENRDEHQESWRALSDALAGRGKKLEDQSKMDKSRSYATIEPK